MMLNKTNHQNKTGNTQSTPNSAVYFFPVPTLGLTLVIMNDTLSDLLTRWETEGPCNWNGLTSKANINTTCSDNDAVMRLKLWLSLLLSCQKWIIRSPHSKNFLFVVSKDSSVWSFHVTPLCWQGFPYSPKTWIWEKGELMTPDGP